MSHHPHNQHQGYDAQAYAQHYQQHAAYSQHAATSRQHPAQSGPTSAPAQHAAAAAYYHHQQAIASSTSSPRSKSGTKRKDKKSRGKHSPTGTLLEVEKQWAAYYEQQRRQQGGGHEDEDDEESQEQQHGLAARRYPEPNFTAFTLAGGKSYLEDGSPSPLSSTSSESGGSTYRTAGSY